MRGLGRLRTVVAYANIQFWIFAVGGALLALALYFFPSVRREPFPVHADRVALSLDPAFTDAHIRLGQAAQTDQRWREARSHFEAAIEADRWNLPAHLGLGIVARELGELERSRGELETARKLARLLPRTHGELGRTLLLLGREEEAREALARGRELGSTDLNLLVLEAVAAARGDHFQIARARFAEARESVGDDVASLLGIARAARSAGMPGDAVATLQVALIAAPENPEVRLEMGSTLLRMRRPEDALEHLEAAHATTVDDTEVLFQLGTAHRALSDEEQARTWWRQVLETEPEHRRARARLGMP
ncbi:MAG: tetratricopeptide repeat protein [Acidobacteriota bacterium]|nr:tetratricopeptide repeat protein [Acidobacteriota bacterium]